MRRVASMLAALALLLAFTAQAFADTQGGGHPASSADKNLWLGVVVLVLLVGSLIVIRPRPRR